MDMDVGTHLLAPGVQGHDYPRLASERFAADLAHSALDGSEQDVVAGGRIGQEQIRQLVGDGKDGMEVGAIKFPRLHPCNPVLALEPATARAMPIVALGVDHARASAVRAVVAVRSVGSISAGEQILQHPSLVPCDRPIGLKRPGVASQYAGDRQRRIVAYPSWHQVRQRDPLHVKRFNPYWLAPYWLAL